MTEHWTRPTFWHEAANHFDKWQKPQPVKSKNPKIYGSEKMLFDAPPGGPLFHHMNDYGSEDDTFSFACSASVREKWFSAA
jgi:hypothetical protein